VFLSKYAKFRKLSNKKNSSFSQQVAGEKETKVKLALELKDLHSQIQHMKIERNKLLAALSEKVRASVS
jgi:hypothetical protein